MSRLILTRGLPASGKTTWARAWVNEQPSHRARVNRDDMRMMLLGQSSALTHKQENHVTAAQHAMVRALTRRGIDVVIDDTCLRDRYVRMWEDYAGRTDSVTSFEFKDFAVPVDECVRRDAQRAHPVGESVIRRMARYLEHGAPRDLSKIDRERPVGPLTPVAEPPAPYERDDQKPSAYIVDLDGTLAIANGRSPYEWARVGEDTVNEDVASVIDDLHTMGHGMVYVSGRDEVCRDDTEAWLGRNHLPPGPLFMRPAGDTRRDSVVKAELFDRHVRGRYAVMGVFDDRNQVVSMWRSMGLTVFQVAEGDF